MRTTKYLMLIAVLFFGMVSSASAQDVLSAKQQEQVAENVSNFIYNLNISERIKPSFKRIVGDFFVGLTALKATKFSTKTNKKIVKTLIKERDSQMKVLLSKDQYKVYKVRAKERQSGIKEFMKEQR